MLPMRARFCVRLTRSVHRCMNEQSASFTSVQGSLRWRQQRDYRRANHEDSDHSRSKGRRWWYASGAPLLGLSWLVTLKDMLGIQPVKLDKDPLKDKVKQSWLHRKYGRYTEAVQVLEIALEEAEGRKEPLPITRIYDELANTYYEMGNHDEAIKYFQIVVNRLITLHGKRDSDPEFIGVSLKLADIFAQKGQLDDAETGFSHCVR
ncbi:tetratricopeptide repeat protein [Cooperia oncophora]